MDKDLKWIKKHYGEEMMHLCRELFPRLLETEGMLPKILSEHFSYNRTLARDIKNDEMVDDFKSYIFSLIDVEVSNNKVGEHKTAVELLDEAGYILYPECTTEDDIQSFRHYYAPEEALCTFKGRRLNYCRVWFAVKKNVDEIRREDFTTPRRQDEYGTSVISIQFTKSGSSTLSIKNRYNHTVNNPDNTFNSNLDNIIDGLTDAFYRDYGVKDSLLIPRYEFELVDYINYNGKYYKYIHEINNIYYCDNNIIIDISHGEVKQLPNSQMLVDYFIFDMQNKTISLYDDIIDDSFTTGFDKIVDIKFSDNQFTIKVEDGDDVIIKINDDREIVSIENNNIIEVANNFLANNTRLSELNLPNLSSCGDRFLSSNRDLKTLSLPQLSICGDNFLFGNRILSELILPQLTTCGSNFLFLNGDLRELTLESIRSCGSSFLSNNEELVELNLPALEKCGNYFLRTNRELSKLDLHSLRTCGDFFMEGNRSVTELNLPSLDYHEWNFLCNHPDREKFLEQIDNHSV